MRVYPQAYPLLSGTKHTTHIRTRVCTHRRIPCRLELKNIAHIHTRVCTYMRIPCRLELKNIAHIHTRVCTYRRIPCRLEPKKHCTLTYTRVYLQAYPLPSGTKKAPHTYIHVCVPTGVSPAVWNFHRASCAVCLAYVLP